MGCDCSNSREKEEEQLPKDTLARCMARSMTLNPEWGRSPRECGVQTSDLIKPLTQAFTSEYRVVTKLQEDEKSALFLAQHAYTEQMCSVKRIEKAVGRAVLQQRALISTETDRLSKLDHPQILRTLEVLEDDNSFYLVSEGFQSHLQDCLHNPRIRKENVAAHMMHQVFRALSYCHNAGIVHGRITLASLVLLDSTIDCSTKVKLTGFGELDELPTKRKSAFRAPEAIHGVNEKCDIWSCGVVLSMMISGTVPSNKENSERRIRRSTTVSTGRQEQSAELVSLLSLLLNRDYQQRPSAAQCLKHPWMHLYIRTPVVRIGLFNACLFNLRKLKNRNPLQEAVLKFIVARILKEKDVENLVNTFYAIDADADGSICEEELNMQFNNLMPEKEAAAATKRVMETVDFGGVGAITFTEFLLSCLGDRKLLSPDNLQTVFRCLSHNSSTLLLQDIASAFFFKRTAEKQRQWREFLFQADRAGGDEVSFSEFSALLTVNLV